MEPALFLYVDAVLRARDALLSANIKVVRYDLYPNGKGALRISDHDRERASVTLAAYGIQFGTAPLAPHPFAIWPWKK